jgi:hypothetical protein
MRRFPILCTSLILVAAGGALAWGFAEMATRLLGSWAQIESSLAPDRTVLLFTLGVLLLAAVLFGLAPLRVALAGGAELALKTSAATSNTDAGKSRTGRIIVAMQMALCVVLLVGGGLLIRTLRNLENTPLGMQIDGLVVFGVKPNITSIPDGIAFCGWLMEKLYTKITISRQMCLSCSDPYCDRIKKHGFVSLRKCILIDRPRGRSTFIWNACQHSYC